MAVATGLSMLALLTATAADAATKRAGRTILRPARVAPATTVPLPTPTATPSTVNRGFEMFVSASGQTSESASGTANPIMYDPGTGTYTIRDVLGSQATMVLTSDEQIAGPAGARFLQYRDASTGQLFTVLNAADANPELILRHVSYGYWSRPSVSSDGEAGTKYVYGVFGSITEPTAMPRTGSASYNAVLDGSYNTINGVHDLSGGATFQANFGNGTLGYALTPVATLGGNSISLGTISGSGTISGATFNGSAGYPYGPYLSRVNGNFYGPSATEVGGSFTLIGLYGSALRGSGGGVFVGTKN